MHATSEKYGVRVNLMAFTEADVSLNFISVCVSVSISRRD